MSTGHPRHFKHRLALWMMNRGRQMLTLNGRLSPAATRRLTEWLAAPQRLVPLGPHSFFQQEHCRSLWVEPAGRKNEPKKKVILYLHGGGYTMCSAVTHRHLLVDLKNRTELGILFPEYRLAPEHPFPAALEDAKEAWRHLLERGYSPSQIIVGGDSAGGGLSLALARYLERTGKNGPAALFLISPWLAQSRESMVPGTADIVDYITGQALEQHSRCYRGSLNAANEYISPGLGPFKKLPPTLVHWGGAEYLARQCRDWVDAMKKHGVDGKEFPGLFHAFHAFPQVFKEASLAMQEISDFIDYC